MSAQVDEAAVTEVRQMMVASGVTVAELIEVTRRTTEALREFAEQLASGWPVGDAMEWSPPADDEDWWTP